MAWSQADETVKAAHSAMNLYLPAPQGLNLDPYANASSYDPLKGIEAPQSAFKLAKERNQPVYSQPYINGLAARIGAKAIA